MGHTIIRILNGLMLLLFVAAAIVQYNDPDPLMWILAYGAGALCCALFLANRLPATFATAIGAVCVLGGLFLLLRIAGPGTFFDTTGREMMGLMEESREMFGLLIVAVWTGFLAWWVYRHPVRSTETSHVS